MITIKEDTTLVGISELRTNIDRILQESKKHKVLIERRNKILEELNAFTQNDNHDKDEHKSKFPQYGDKSDENAMEISEYTTNIATEKVLEDTLRDINATLKRIEENTYGICKYCRKEIGEKRMLARPVASTCIECKTKLQKTA